MKALAAIGGAMLLAFGATQADATIYLAMQAAGVNGGAVTTVATDGGTGNLTYGLGYGSFMNSIIVQGYPTLNQPELQTASINTTTGVAGKLTIYVTQDGLTTSTGSMISSLTANRFLNNVTSVTLSTYYSAANALFTGTQLATSTFTAANPTGVSFTSPVSGLTGPYSETAKYEITFGGAGSANNTINLSAGAVPEPATWALMLAGFGFVGFSLRQRRRAAVSFG